MNNPHSPETPPDAQRLEERAYQRASEIGPTQGGTEKLLRELAYALTQLRAERDTARKASVEYCNLYDQEYARAEKAEADYAAYREQSIQTGQPTLICAECHNTTSLAAVWVRDFFNPGRCVCGGLFKVFRA